MKFKPFCITLVILFFVVLTRDLTAQNLSGRENSQPMGKSASVSKLNQGNYSGDVSPFTGALQSSYSMGEVSTPLGIKFNVGLSYSSTFNCSENQQVISGIPYGEGWDVNVPKITISTEAINKIRTFNVGNYGHGIVELDDMVKHGSLTWFAPVISIPGVINERFVFKHKKGGNFIFVPCAFETYVEAIFNGQVWKVKLPNGTIYEFNLSITAISNASNINVNPNTNATESEIAQDYQEYLVRIENYNNFRNEQISLNSEMEAYFAEPLPTGMTYEDFAAIYTNGREDKIKQALLNILMPKPQILSWYCNTIYNPAHPSNQKITFNYETGGVFNYFKEYSYDYQNVMTIAMINRLITSSTIQCNPISPENCRSVFGVLPDFYVSKHIILKSVAASVENTITDYIDLNYETISSPDFKNVPVLESNKVFAKKVTFNGIENIDNFYNWSSVYDVGVNSTEEMQEMYGNNIVSDQYTQHENFDDWYRYHHIMSDYAKLNLGTVSGQDIDPSLVGACDRINPKNPYQYSSGGYKFFRTKQSDYSSGTNYSMPFDHSFLESKSIAYGTNTSQTMPTAIPGDIYEVRTMISNPEHMCSYDINIVAGSENDKLHSREERTPLAQNIGKYQSDVIFSTFNQAIKWNSRGTSRNRLVTSNLFTFPNLPIQYNGFNIQVGPANSNHKFNHMVNGQFQHFQASETYAWMDDIINSDKVTPMSNVPNNFGIGMPWYMVKDVIDYINDPQDGTAPGNLNDNYADFWFNDISPDHQKNYTNVPNIPTLSDKNSYLHALALIRYSQNPYMLKSVSHYKLNGEDKSSGLEMTGDYVLIEQYDLRYKVENTYFTNPGLSKESGINIDLTSTGIQRNIILLDQIATMPIIASNGTSIQYKTLNSTDYAGYYTQGLKSHFEYSGILYTKTYMGAVGMAKELKCTIYPLTKITNQLGGETVIAYYSQSTGAVLENITYLGYYAPLPYLQYGDIRKAADINVSVQLVVNSITRKGRNTQDDKITSYQYGTVVEKSIIPKALGVASASIKERSFKGFTNTTIFTPIGNSKFKTERIDFYTDDAKFGKPQKTTEKEDSKIVKTTENIYSPLKISNRVDVNWNGYEKSSSPATVGGVYQNVQLAITTFNRSDNYLLSIPFTENFQVPMSFHESYFIRKTKNVVKNYDQTDALNQRYISHTSEYSYWDADWAKKSTTIGYKILNVNIPTESSSGKFLLDFQPSYQLYSERKYSDEQPFVYSLDEYFYYYDLPVAHHAPFELPETSIYSDGLNWARVVYNILTFGVRDIAYEKRTTKRGGTDDAPVRSSTYFIYDSRWGREMNLYKTTETINTTNCPPTQTVIGLEGSGNNLFPGVQYWLTYLGSGNLVNKPLVMGYKQLGITAQGSFPEMRYSAPTYTPPVEPNFNYVTTSTNKGMNPNLIFLRKVVNQMSMFVAPAGPTASGIEDRAILRFSLNTNEVEFPVTNNLTVKEILERNGVGLITKEKDEKGLVTKYDFNEAKLIYYRCSTTTQNSNNGRYIGSTTSWSLPLLPIKETYGLGASYPLIYNYQYTPQLQLSKTIEPNAKELLFKYDAFGRLNKSQIGDGTNIYTIQETGYHNWSSIMGQSFDQNAANNYIETKTYNNFTGTDFNITRSYMDPMGRQYQKVYENYYGSEHLKTGEVYYDELNNPKTVNKSFVSSTSTPEYRSAQLSQRYYHQDDGNGNYVIQPFSQSYIPSSNVYEKNSNGRILGAAKAGRQISSTDKYVSSEYSIITLNQLNAELGTNYTSNVSITNSFAAIMAIPNNTLTNYLLTNAPLYLAAKALQGYGEASPSQKVRDDYIVSSIMTADKNKYYKTKIIDEDGNETRLYYTPDGNKIAERKSISNDNNAVTLFSYDARGNLIKIVNPEKQTSRFKYNFANWQYSSETPDGNVVTRIFNLSGQVMLEQDDNGRKGSDFKSSFMRGYDYDDMGRLVKQKKVSPRFQNFNPMSYLYVDPDAANPDAEINKVWDQCIDPRKAVTEIKAMFASVKINVAPLEFFVAAEFQCDVIPVSTSLAQPPTQLKWHPSNAMATRIPRMDIFFDDPWNDGGSDHSFLQPETPETIADGFLNESSYGWIYTCPYSLNMVCGEETLEKEWDYNNNRSENEVYKLNTKNYVSYIGPNAVTEIIDVQSLNTLNRLSRSISYDNKGNDIEQIIYSYDVFGNIIAESHFFNAYGLKTNAAHRATINYQYDLQGRILSEDVETEQYNNGQSYSFNLSSSYQYQYDRYGRLKTVGEDGNKKVTYKYDPISNKILERAYYRKVDQDNPITRHTYKYDLRDRLTDLCAKWTTDNLFYEELTYDDNIPTTLPIGSTWNSGNKNYNGNINGTVSNYAIRGMFAPGINAYWIGSPISKQYYYDKNSRLTYLDNNSPSVKNIYDGNVTSFGDESFTYDKAGSFTEQKYYTLDPVNSNAVLHTRSYKYKPGTGQAYEVSETGAAGYFVYTNKYDKTGNIRQDKSMNHSPVTDEYISYGRSNMPFSYYRHGNQKDLFLYNINDYRIYQHFYNEQDEYHIVDYQGRVVGIKKDLNSYTCGSENYTWIVNGNGKEVEYSPSKSINEQYRYFVKDHLGNIRISNSFNEQHPENLEYYTVSAYDYTAYGKILKSHVPQDKFLTTDNERDMKTGYDYRHHRFSDAETGRFLTVDPLANQFPSWSPYNYTEDNPVNKIDPLGLSANPIYGTDGAFLGTDDLGLQGQAIIMNRSDFTQGMRHTDAVSKNLGAAGLNGAGARSAFISHFRAQGNGGSVYGTAVPIALTAAAVDGPLPIGDIIGGVILAGATAYDATQRTFVTYTMRNAAGQTYVGRTSGYGDPYSIMMNRASGHHMKAFGYGSPVLDRAVQGYQGYPAIRGREQQLIDFYGGIGSPGVGNSIRGVSSYNPAYPIYHGASNLYFGPLAPYTGY